MEAGHWHTKAASKSQLEWGYWMTSESMKYGPVVPNTQIKQEIIEGNVLGHPFGDIPRQCLSSVDVTVGCEDWLTLHMKTSLLCSWKTSCHSTHSRSSKLRISCFLLRHHSANISHHALSVFPSSSLGRTEGWRRRRTGLGGCHLLQSAVQSDACSDPDSDKYGF